MKLKGLIAKKEGMTRIFSDSGEVIPVTVLNASECTIVGFRRKEKEGYDAVQLGIDAVFPEKLNRPERGFFKKNNIPESFRKIIEVPVKFEDNEDLKPFLGKRVKIEEVFKPGSRVKVRGISKGRGFQGVVKRWGFAGGPDSHGSSLFHRRPGSIGTNTFPGRIIKGKKMPGHMGAKTVTILNLEVVKILENDGLILVKGGVPGPRGGFIVLEEYER